MPGLAVDDVVNVVYRSRLFDQRIIYSLHYRVSVAGQAGTVENDLADVALLFADTALGSLLDNMMGVHTLQFTFESVRTQRVWPSLSVFREALINVVGLNANTTPSANIAVSLQKQTNRPGRPGIGRVQLAGVPSTHIAAGVLTQAGLTAYQNVGNGFLQGRTTPNTTTSLIPCLFNPSYPGIPKFADLVGMKAQDTVRTMHRRTVRVGE